MAHAVEQVPAETRWTIATQGLTSAVTATNKAVLDMLGREKYDQFIGQIWAEGAKAAKQIADALGLPGDDAKSVAVTATSIATVIMGPEFKFETVEATAGRTVVRCAECPWWNRTQELEISDDLCSVGDLAWTNSLVKALNPKVAVTLTKAMPRGDQFCEWVYELQK
jgi:hypothetical protein